MTLGLLMVLGVPGLTALTGLAGGLAGAATPSPSPTTGGELDPLDVSPGLLGFLVTFGLVVVCIALFVSMTRILRRVGRRPEDGDGDSATDAPGTHAGGSSPEA